MSEYRLGRRSTSNLVGVHPDLIRVVQRAIQITPCDFTVTEGVRTHKRQRQLLKAGKSRTERSRHIPAISSITPEYGSVAHAVDLVAWVDGAVCWDWPCYFQIADAMKQAAEELDVDIEWGGGWCHLADFDCAEDAQDAYLARCNKEGRKTFADGPHFQLSWKEYPIV